AACNGVHGANRLASNSLLEGLVFGARAAQAMLTDGLAKGAAEPDLAGPPPLSAAGEREVEDAIASLQTAMWAHAGLLRDDDSLRQGVAAQAACASRLDELARDGTSRRLVEGRSLCRVAHAILQCALARTESRGAHFRNDFPRRDDAGFGRHSILGRDGKVRFEDL
ncbi:MAG: L-aspartate oxidase, partial [Acidobacteriota bacterium]